MNLCDLFEDGHVPKIWYHGTKTKFSSFNLSYTTGQIGFHFGTLEQAEWRLGNDPGYIIKVQVDLQNPIRLEDQGSWYGNDFIQQLKENPLTSNFKWHASMSDMAIRKGLQHLGYDGIIYLNMHEGEADNREDSIIVFDPSKIRILSRASHLLTETKIKTRPTSKDIADIGNFRHKVRCEERNGGQCGFVAEYIADKFGWGAVSGTYCNDADEPICIGHVWNVLPDGAIFDSTADQLGMGHDMKIVPKNDPDFKHYRYEWSSENEFTPDHPNAPKEIRGMKWSGKDDYDWADELRTERGEDWHVTDKKQYADYLKKEKMYQTGKFKS